MSTYFLRTRPTEPQLADGVCATANGRAAVETFIFEVSAGRKLGQPLPAAGAINPAGTPADGRPASRSAEAAISARPAVRVARRLKKPWQPPSWLVSFGLHGALIGILGCIGIPGLQQSFDFALTMSDDPGIVEEVAVEEITIEPLEESAELAEQLAAEVVQTSFTANDLDAEATLSDLSTTAMADAALSDIAGLVGTEELADVVPAGDKLTASFFGAKVAGRRIVYVLDNSGGMQNGGLETLLAELLKSVESLSPKQEFYVIFYSDMVYPMFHPRGVERFVPANDRFKKRLKAWLDSVEFCVGNTVDEAIQTAAMIRPDAVYLLTDGNVDTTRDGRKLAALLDTRGRSFPIHTFGIGMGERSKAAENLRRVAEANDGTFRIVEVSDEAKELARQKNRPYHSEEPGRNWGLNVGRGWGSR